MSKTTAQFSQMVREGSKWEAWEVENLYGNEEDGDLFACIITADKGRTLIAQVTSREAAETIVREHNRGMP